MLTETNLKESDCVVIVTGHRGLDYDWLTRHAALVVDSCNATAHVTKNSSSILRLGAPHPTSHLPPSAAGAVLVADGAGEGGAEGTQTAAVSGV
jgi:hypothetical protein